MPNHGNFRSRLGLPVSLNKRRSRPLLALLGVVMAALWLQGCVASSSPTANTLATNQANGPAATQPASVQPAAFSSNATGSYRIGPLDVLDITVFQVPELTKSVQ